MKIAICNSKTWFRLNNQISSAHKIYNFKTNDDLTLEALDKFEPDLVFFPHWNWIVSSKIFEKYTCIVFHTSPLPFGRGGSPIQNLIRCGYTTSPVCALAMSEEIDSGPIYDQMEISLDGTLSEILVRLNGVVNKLMLRLIDNLPEPVAQTGYSHTFGRLGYKDNEILSTANMAEMYDAIRMLDDPSYPNAYLRLEHVCFEFSEICRKGDTLICKVHISPRGGAD